MRRFTVTTVIALYTVLFVAICSAQQAPTTAIPNLIRYSGTLKDAQGAVPSLTTVGVTFAIYKEQDGGAPVWQETHNVTPDANGQYSIVLGSTTTPGLPNDLFAQQEQRWLGVQVQGQAEQARVLLVSVPYAFKAHEAETLGGLPASAFVKAPPTDAAGSTGTGIGAAATADGAFSKKDTTLPPAIQTGYIPVYTSFLGTTKDSQLRETPGGLYSNETINLAQFGYSYQIFGSDLITQHLGANLPVGILACPHPNGTRGTDIDNTCVGQSAGTNDTAGGSNTFLGAYAGMSNTLGSNNTFTGYSAGHSNNYEGDKTSLGSNNTFNGYQAGFSNTDAGDNTFVGYQSGYNNTTILPFYARGMDNTFSGSQSGFHNTFGQQNTFSGYQAGFNNTTGSTNTFLGSAAGFTNTLGGNNTFTGWNAGRLTTTGTNNTFSGSQAGTGNNVGSSNAYFGDSAGYNGNGSNNAFLGASTGYLNTGSDNTFIGVEAGYNNTADYNTFSGFQAGRENTAGQLNTFSGYQTGYNNRGQSANTFLGAGAGYNTGNNGNDNVGGNNNTFLGAGAGFNNGVGKPNKGGNSNIFLGLEAGFNNISGNDDIYIGNMGPGSATESEAIRIGTSQTATYVAGIWAGSTGTGTLDVVCVDSTGKLWAAPFKADCTLSSRRFKEQIADMGDSSSKLFELRPVTFLYKPQYDDGSHLLQYGLIAEEVAKVYADMVAYDKDGQILTVKYQLLAPMLLNELQKQHAVVTTQQGQIQTQTQQIQDLQQRLLRMETLLENR